MSHPSTDASSNGQLEEQVVNGQLDAVDGSDEDATTVSVRPHQPISVNGQSIEELAVEERQRRRRFLDVLDTAGEAVNNGTPATRAAVILRADLDDFERAAGTARPSPRGILELIADHPRLRPPVIDGLLREGETANIIAAPKVGKSWMAYLLALKVATGGNWLGRHPCRQGRVLIVDYELHPESLANRLPTVTKALELTLDDYHENLDILSLRGHKTDLHGVGQLLEQLDKNTYDLVILDALYRALPEGTSENDNAAMAGLFNAIDGIAGRLNCCWVNIHHASKGDQSGKSITDVGAGAGSQSRAADCHIILRPHEEAGCIVMEAVVRSFAPVEPLALRWEFPLWSPDNNLDAEKLKGRGSPAEQKKRQADTADMLKIEQAITTGGKTERQLRGLIGSGPERTQRLLAQLEMEHRIQSGKRKVNGGKATIYKLPKVQK